jgi:hypothetical protein
MFSSNNSQVANDVKYIEEYFSTFLYSGTSSSQTITNGIDLSTKGGLIWTKCRSAAYDHQLIDTARGGNQILYSNLTNGSSTTTPAIVSFGTTGYTINSGAINALNNSGSTFASWSIAKTPKFFDVVTYTGNGSGNRIITSSLGSPIGCVFIKRTDSTSNWATAHRKDGSAVATGLSLNTTAAALYPNSTNDTFDATGGFNAGYIVDSTGDGVNVNGATYVAYLFAHNAGGFGLTGTDNVISCSSAASTGGGVLSVTLGYEPQWLMVKRTNSSTNGDWVIVDNMRGLTADPNNVAPNLRANLTNSENTASYQGWSINSTGFQWTGAATSSNYIYIAIRRGPMKVPTDGTKVFKPVAQTAGGTVTTNFPVDLSLLTYRNYAYNKLAMDRLRGGTTNSYKYLATESTSAETTGTGFGIGFDNNNAIVDTGFLTSPSYDGIYWNFKRAPSFFDEVCYTGTGSVTNVTHNLGVAPELVIVKIRDAGGAWYVYNKDLTSAGYYLLVNSTAAQAFSNGLWNSTQPTSSVFTVGTGSGTNGNGSTYVAYLFATAPGVSKVGSYTGTGTTLQVNCGFTAGARFVLIKKTSGTGSWYVWDSARGIVSGNDPYLLLNSTAAEVTNTDYIDTYSAGFEISSTAPSEINENGGSFIFFAVA